MEKWTTHLPSASGMCVVAIWRKSVMWTGSTSISKRHRMFLCSCSSSHAHSCCTQWCKYKTGCISDLIQIFMIYWIEIANSSNQWFMKKHPEKQQGCTKTTGCSLDLIFFKKLFCKEEELATRAHSIWKWIGLPFWT